VRKTAFIAALLLLVVGVQAQALETAVSKFKIKFYGFIATEAIYDAHGNNGAELMQWCTSNSKDARDFRITARNTRFGLNISDTDGTSAVIETDFWGQASPASATGAPAGNVDLRLRHAYVKKQFNKFELLAGQTWELMPLEFPGISNSMILGYSGCLWSREPQIRGTFKPAEPLTVALAVTRPTRYLSDNAGTASGKPGYQGQIQAKIGQILLTGAAGYSQWASDTRVKANCYYYDLGFRIPIGSKLTINGQVWKGQNMDDYLGGIGNMGYAGSSIKAWGGFANLKFQPADRWWFNFGYGQDDPKDDHLKVGDKIKNQTGYGNITYQLTDSIQWLAEYAQNSTNYKLAPGAGKDRRSNMRYTTTITYFF